MGLAVYNGTILDIHLPSFCYKKLLSPSSMPTDRHTSVGIASLSVRDLAEIMPVSGSVVVTFFKSLIPSVPLYKVILSVLYIYDYLSDAVYDIYWLNTVYGFLVEVCYFFPNIVYFTMKSSGGCYPYIWSCFVNTRCYHILWAHTTSQTIFCFVTADNG